MKLTEEQRAEIGRELMEFRASGTPQMYSACIDRIEQILSILPHPVQEGGEIRSDLKELIKRINHELGESYKSEEDPNYKNWGMQNGILLTPNEARYLLNNIEWLISELESKEKEIAELYKQLLKSVR